MIWLPAIPVVTQECFDVIHTCSIHQVWDALQRIVNISEGTYVRRVQRDTNYIEGVCVCVCVTEFWVMLSEAFMNYT